MTETMACNGAETRSVHITGVWFEECTACRTRVASDLVEHPFFGFAAGCPRMTERGAVPTNTTRQPI